MLSAETVSRVRAVPRPDDATRREFAARLRAMRAYANVSRADIADALGLKVETDNNGNRRSKTVENWEAGKSIPTPSQRRELSAWLSAQSRAHDAMGFGPRFLVDLTSPPAVDVPALEVRRQLDSALRTMLQLRDSLPPAEAGERPQ